MLLYAIYTRVSFQYHACRSHRDRVNGGRELQKALLLLEMVSFKVAIDDRQMLGLWRR
jgi:hypothetical protein